MEDVYSLTHAEGKALKKLSVTETRELMDEVFGDLLDVFASIEEDARGILAGRMAPNVRMRNSFTDIKDIIFTLRSVSEAHSFTTRNEYRVSHGLKPKPINRVRSKKDWARLEQLNKEKLDRYK